MNKRQKKKLFKQTLIKVRKLHPQKNDVICFQPDLDWIDAETMCQFMKVYSNNDVFGESKLAFVPADIKQHIFFSSKTSTTEISHILFL